MTHSLLALLVALALVLGCRSQEPNWLPGEVTATVTGHQEAQVQADGSLIATWVGLEQPAGFCLSSPLSTDTSQWRARLRFNGVVGEDGEASEAGFAPPDARAGTTLCFLSNLPKPVPSSSASPLISVEICGTVQDAFDGKELEVPCTEALWRADDSAFKSLLSRGSALVASKNEQSAAEFAKQIDLFVGEVEGQGYPFLALQLRLVAISELDQRGDGAHQAEVRRRLEGLPVWLNQPQAAAKASTVTYMRATAAASAGSISSSSSGASGDREAWELLAQGEAAARSVAAPVRLAIVRKQAEILHLRGDQKQSLQRLQRALDECEHWPCWPAVRTDAHGAMAWYLLVDPDTDSSGLEVAGKHLDAQWKAHQEGGALSPSETANILINRGLLFSRSHRDPRPLLGEARDLLHPLDSANRRTSLLVWADTIEGLWSLKQGEPEKTVRLCQQAVDRVAVLHGGALPQSSLHRDRAWAWSCLGQGFRRLGEKARALQAFEQALVFHGAASPDSREGLPLAPGQRVDDYYRAARAAVEIGEPSFAWRFLEALDLLLAESAEDCSERGVGASKNLLSEDLQERRRSLLERLAWTEPPLAPDRSRQLEPVRESLLQALEDLHLGLLVDCAQRSRRPVRQPDIKADFRAFALPEEVILLQKRSSGEISLRRTPWSRLELRQQLAALTRAQGQGQMTDDAWRSMTSKLSRALAPDNAASLGPLTRFALHGPLQGVPLAALTVSDSAAGLDSETGVNTPASNTPESNGGASLQTGNKNRGVISGSERPQTWLGDLTTVVLHPPVIAARASVDELQGGDWDEARQPLFVIDPTLTLASSGSQGNVFRELYPDAVFLEGTAATRLAMTRGLPSASFLHVDSHGSFEAAFPTLSHLELHDGPFDVGDFLGTEFPHRLINLSGCFTGSSAEAGDSSLFGLAGILAQRGVGWVVGSRSAVSDRLLADFNQRFYGELSGGRSITSAFREALGRVISTYPAASWSNLVLVGAGSPAKQISGVTGGAPYVSQQASAVSRWGAIDPPSGL